MSEQSDKKLKALNDTEYAQAIRTALQAMVVDQLPNREDIDGQMTLLASLDQRGYLSRKGAYEQLGVRIVHAGGNADRTVIWLEDSGQTNVSIYDQIVKDRTCGMMVISPFKSSESPETIRPTAVATTGRAGSNPNPAYEGYNLGYNRSVIAEQVHDILTAIAYARGENGVKRVSIIASGKLAPAALIACVIAGGKIDKAAIDFDGFDFDQIKTDTDPRLLPGALKYGGIAGFIPALSTGSYLIANVSHKPTRTTPPGVEIEAGAVDALKLADFVTKP